MTSIKPNEIICPECKSPLHLIAEVRHAVLVMTPTEDPTQYKVVDAEDVGDCDDEHWRCPNGHEIPIWMYDDTLGEDGKPTFIKFDTEEDADAYWAEQYKKWFDNGKVGKLQ